VKEFPPFRLDPVNQCLWRRTASAEDERVLLTPTEFGVLDHLVAHAGRLVTHRDLLDAVWPRTAIEPQAVKSKIFHLRRALDDDPKQPRFIETVSRRGYRFVGRIEGGSAVGDAPSRVPAPTHRLVGRDGAIDDLWRSMRTASAGAPQVVFVTGEAGIGKTAVVEEFERQVASERTVRIARGQCVEGFGSKEAFYSVLDAVGELCQGPDVAATVDLLASHAPTWLAQFPALLTRHHHETLKQEILGATRERMLREICEALEEISRPAPLLLVLEDLHWADASTLDLISALARHRRSARLMLVVTYRPTDVAHSAQPLHSLKRDLVARHLCREIILPPLSAAEIGHYLAQSVATSAAGVPEELASLLHRHTEGNPLFMVAVLEHLMERGLVERDSDGWRLRRPAAEIGLEVPESLREMTGAQIDRLGELEQRALEVAAIAGMSFAPAICAPSADMDAISFEECCDSLARRGHILRLADERQLPTGNLVQCYAFVHALYPRVLYERQAPARRARLHRRRGEQLEKIFAGAHDDVALELAHHFEKGTDWPSAVKYLRRAADVASRRFSLDGARASLQHALALVDRLPASERPAAEMDLLYSLAGIDLATLDEGVVDTLTILRAKAAEHGRVDVEVQALVDLAYPLAWSSSARSIEVIDQALRLSNEQRDPLMRARTRSRCMVRRLMARGWDAQDAEESRSALAEIRRLGTREDVAWHLIDSGFLELTASRYRQVRRDASIQSLASGRCTRASPWATSRRTASVSTSCRGA
jgi:Predicted ATPase